MSRAGRAVRCRQLLPRPSTGLKMHSTHITLALVAMLAAVLSAAAFVPASPGPFGPMSLDIKQSSCRRSLSTTVMMNDGNRRAVVAGIVAVPFFLADRCVAQKTDFCQHQS